MIKMIKKHIHVIIIFITAAIVSLAAACYSVYGLSKLFSGASIAVIIMAGSLEFAKLILAATLDIYWKQMEGWIKYYSAAAVVILMCITSAGIYGFLSDAYQTTAHKDEIVGKRIGIVQSKIDNYKVRLDEHKVELSTINASSLELNKALNTNSQVQTVKNGQVLTSIQVTNKRPIENQLNQINSRKETLNGSISSLQDSIQKLEIQIIELNANNEGNSELGPLKYLAGLTGFPMNKIVNIFLIMLMLVFDPLAISLIMLGIFVYNQSNEEKTTNEPVEPNEPILNEPESIQPDPEPIPEPVIEKKKRKPRAKRQKVEHNDTLDYPKTFDIKIEGLEELPVVEKPKGKRKVVDNGLTHDTSQQIDTALNKRLSPSQIKNMPHEQIEEWHRINKS